MDYRGLINLAVKWIAAIAAFIVKSIITIIAALIIAFTLPLANFLFRFRFLFLLTLVANIQLY